MNARDKSESKDAVLAAANDDDEIPELTKEWFARARPASEVLPPKLYADLLEMNRRAGVRGPQKSPKKVATAIRLSPEVVDYFKADGPGWQTRVDAALQDYVRAHKAV